MRKFGFCALYLIAIGVLSQLAALLPRRLFHAERFPYRAYKWEQDGDIYRKIGITRWKDKLPDMSKILPFLKKKAVSVRVTAREAERLIQETCVAEMVHIVLSVMTFACVLIYPGAGGWILSVVYVLVGHVPFILIQRYNRPRFVRMHEMLLLREAKKFPQI